MDRSPPAGKTRHHWAYAQDSAKSWIALLKVLILSSSAAYWHRGIQSRRNFCPFCTNPVAYAFVVPAVAKVGGDAAGATFVRSRLPVVYAVVVPALAKYAKDGAPASVVASAV